MQKQVQENNYEYVGLFSGLPFLRKPVKKLMQERKISDDTIIHVRKASQNSSGNVHKTTIEKQVQKGRKTMTIKKDIYFMFRSTGHIAWALSIPAMPVRIFEKDEQGNWWDWTIPQSAREESVDAYGKRWKKK